MNDSLQPPAAGLTGDAIRRDGYRLTNGLAGEALTIPSANPRNFHQAISDTAAMPRQDLWALSAALKAGWRFQKGRPRGHVWGFLLCPQSDREGCRIRVYATPRNTDDHAAAIRTDMARCPHAEYPREGS